MMALSATMYHFQISLSDVERGVYTEIDLRVARHPSESFRYMMTRTLAYALLYEEGIAFSKGGLSASEEAPLSVRDRTGALEVWIEIGAPSAERLHKASKAAPRVVLFTHTEPNQVRKEANSRAVHKLESIEFYALEPAFLDRLEPLMTRNTSFEILRNEGRLYVTLGGQTEEVALELGSLRES